jgi:hypothetical protein
MSKRNRPDNKRARREQRRGHDRDFIELGRYHAGFYLMHRCGHPVTWLMDEGYFPAEMRESVSADVLFQQINSALTADRCPWCKGLAPMSRKVIRQREPGANDHVYIPVEMIWQEWLQECPGITPAIRLPNPPPPSAEFKFKEFK